ncbi:N-acetylmuramoyl-L-alanine amidase [Jhaorihella thermophila]|uniref:N-acetylmuramoyl-L-alanine amidase n=2 Tax=Jhaorihella thermophila TaxID=488547 RepID=A0A1H5W0Y0_9RHOB|nr:N-acetylmuramoyl-L-alanine amidase [Jhaorihella thermophila]
MHGAEAALERLCDPAAEVSAHYLIGMDGTVWQLVEESERAWHAGAGEWGGQGDVNSRSIGIELDNLGNHPFAEPQMAALERLLADIMTRWSIPPHGVIGHSDMAPGRKRDPGPRFDWARLARLGLARNPGRTTASHEPPGFDEFRRLARAAGYDDTIPDELLLETVRLRYRPWALGPLGAEDLAVLST